MLTHLNLLMVMRIPDHNYLLFVAATRQKQSRPAVLAHTPLTDNTNLGREFCTSRSSGFRRMIQYEERQSRRLCVVMDPRFDRFLRLCPSPSVFIGSMALIHIKLALARFGPQVLHMFHPRFLELVGKMLPCHSSWYLFWRFVLL